MDLDDAMYNGDVPILHLEDEYLPSLHRVLPIVGEEEKVTSIECRLHATTVGTHRERGREGGREGEGGMGEGGREGEGGGREGGREGGKEGERGREREGGREGERERESRGVV